MTMNLNSQFKHTSLFVYFDWHLMIGNFYFGWCDSNFMVQLWMFSKFMGVIKLCLTDDTSSTRLIRHWFSDTLFGFRF